MTNEEVDTDVEIAALRAIIDALKPFDPSTRERMMAFLISWARDKSTQPGGTR